MHYSQNTKMYYLYATFANLLILGPIIVLFLIAKGLTFTEIMVLQSIYSAGIVLFEVPTGAVADKFSRKISMLLGAILVALGLTIYILGEHFYIYILAELTFALGFTLKSGADSALIYDSLKADGNEKEFQKIEGKARSYSFYAQAVGSIIAGFVYEVNMFLPLIISIGFMAITAVIALSFKEVPVEGKVGKYGIAYTAQIIESGKYILNHGKIKAIIVFSTVFFIFYRTGFWLFQPYMESVDIPVKYFGILFFIFNITAAFVSKRSHLFIEKTKPKTLMAMAYLMIISFVILGFIHLWIGVLAILLQQAARGLYQPVTHKYLNKHIPSDKRATILSFHSLISNIAVAITFPFMGLLKDNTNIFTTHLILALLMIFFIYLASFYMNKRLGKPVKTEISA